MATTLQQAKSLQEQIKSYRKGVIAGDEEGTTSEVVDDDGSTPIELPIDDNPSVEDMEKVTKRNVSYYYTLEYPNTSEQYYVQIYTIEKNGVSYSSNNSYAYAWTNLLCYALYDKNGNAIVTDLPIKTLYSQPVGPSNACFFKTEYLSPQADPWYNRCMGITKIEIRSTTIFVTAQILHLGNSGTDHKEETGTPINSNFIPAGAKITRTTTEKPF